MRLLLSLTSSWVAHWQAKNNSMSTSCHGCFLVNITTTLLPLHTLYQALSQEWWHSVKILLNNLDFSTSTRRDFCVPLVFYTITNWLSVSAQISITTCKSTSISRSALSPPCSILFVYYLTSYAALNYIFLLLAALETFLRLTASSSVSAGWESEILLCSPSSSVSAAVEIHDECESRLELRGKSAWEWKISSHKQVVCWCAALLWMEYHWEYQSMLGGWDEWIEWCCYFSLSVFESRSLFSLRCALTFPSGWCFFFLCARSQRARARLSGEKEEISFFTFSSFLALLSCFTLVIFSFLFSSKELQQLSMRIRWIFHFLFVQAIASHRSSPQQLQSEHSETTTVGKVSTPEQQQQEKNYIVELGMELNGKWTFNMWRSSQQKEKSWISLSRNSQEIKL